MHGGNLEVLFWLIGLRAPPPGYTSGRLMLLMPWLVGAAAIAVIALERGLQRRQDRIRHRDQTTFVHGDNPGLRDDE